MHRSGLIPHYSCPIFIQHTQTSDPTPAHMDTCLIDFFDASSRQWFRSLSVLSSFCTWQMWLVCVNADLPSGRLMYLSGVMTVLRLPLCQWSRTYYCPLPVSVSITIFRVWQIIIFLWHIVVCNNLPVLHNLYRPYPTFISAEYRTAHASQVFQQPTHCLKTVAQT